MTTSLKPNLEKVKTRATSNCSQTLGLPIWKTMNMRTLSTSQATQMKIGRSTEREKIARRWTKSAPIFAELKPTQGGKRGREKKRKRRTRVREKAGGCRKKAGERKTLHN